MGFYQEILKLFDFGFQLRKPTPNKQESRLLFFDLRYFKIEMIQMNVYINFTNVRLIMALI